MSCNSRVVKKFSSYPIWWLLPVSLVILAVAVGFNRRLVHSQPVQASTAVSVLPVDTITVEPVQDYQSTRVYTGELVARRSSDLGFERAGQVVVMLVDEGSLVEPNTPLARLDTSALEVQRQQLLALQSEAMAKLQELQAGTRPEEIAIAQAQVAEISEQLNLEQIKRQRRENLYLEGAISREQLDEVGAESNRLEARLAQAQSRLNELNAGPREEQIAAQSAVLDQFDARLASLDLEISKSTLRAPFAGTVAARSIDEGTVVAAGQSVLQLIEISAVEARVGVPVTLVDQLPVGSQHQVQVNGKSHTATVTSLQPQLDTATRTVTVILQLETDLVTTSVPGQLLNLKLAETVPTSGFWMPTTALTQGAQGLWYCYMLVKSGAEQPSTAPDSRSFTVQRSQLEVLHTQGDRVLVRGTLQPGDRVVKSGIHRLSPGQRVRTVSISASARKAS